MDPDGRGPGRPGTPVATATTATAVSGTGTEGPGAEGPGTEGAGDGTGDRRIRMSTGYEMHAWADLRPAGEDPSKAPRGPGRKLWHQSQGSAG